MTYFIKGKECILTYYSVSSLAVFSSNTCYSSQLQELQNEICKQRAVLDHVSDVGKDIIGNSNENPLVVADVQGKLTKVRVEIDRLDARIEQRHAILQNILLQIQVFDVMLEEFITKVAELEDEVNNRKPISAILDVVSAQRDRVQHNVSDIARKQVVFDKVLHDGLRMLDRMEPGSEKDIQQEILDKVTSRWDAVKTKSTSLLRFVEEVHEASQRYDSRALDCKVWLKDVEKKEDMILPVGCDMIDVNNSIKELDEVFADIDTHKTDFDELEEAATKIISVCEADGEVIKADFHELKSRWKCLQVTAAATKKEVEQAKEAIEKYQSALQPVQEAFTQAEYALTPPEPIGIDTERLSLELEHIKALVSTLNERKGDVNQVNMSGQQLLQQAINEAPSAQSVKEQLIETNKKSKELPVRLQERQKELEKTLEDTLQFNGLCEEIKEWLADTLETVAALGSVSTEPEVLQEQIKETDRLQEEVRKYLIRLLSLEETGQRLVEGSMQNPDVVSNIQSKIDEARNPLGKLSSKLEQRTERLRDAALQSQEFNDLYVDFSAHLSGILERLLNLPPLSPDYPITRRQKDESDAIEDSIMQLNPLLEKLLVKGEKVMEDRGTGENKDTLRDKLDDLREKWLEVNKRAEERSNLIMSVISEARTFHVVLEMIEPWLTDTENKLEMIRVNSFSPEELSLQQKELEELQKSTENRKPDFDRLRTAAELLEKSCKDDSYFVEVQMKDIFRRWEALLRDTVTKKTEVEVAKDNAVRYCNALEVVEDVIQNAESLLNYPEQTNVDVHQRKDEASKINQALENLAKCEPRERELQQVGDRLVQQMETDSVKAVILKQQLNHVEDKFNYILIKARNLNEKMGTIVTLTSDFAEKYDVLVAWMEDVTVVVESLQGITANPRLFKSQLEDVERIQEDVVMHRYNLDTLRGIGEQLINYCENNPALLMQINSKISKLVAHLDTLSNKLNDQHQRLQVSVLHTQQFQETLDDFVLKLERLEDDVAGFQPISSSYQVLRTQSQDTKCASEDVKQLQPVFIKVSRGGDQLLESLGPGDEKDDLRETLSDLASRWNSVTAVIDKRQAKVDKVAIVGKPFHDTLQRLLPWMSDYENWLASLGPVSCDEKVLSKEQEIISTMTVGLEDHRPDIDTMNDAARNLADLCDDVHVTQAEVKDVNKRWGLLTEGATIRRQHVAAVKGLLDQLTCQLKPIEDKLEQADIVLRTPPSYLTDSEKGELELTKIEVTVLRFCNAILLTEMNPAVSDISDASRAAPH